MIKKYKVLSFLVGMFVLVTACTASSTSTIQTNPISTLSPEPSSSVVHLVTLEFEPFIWCDEGVAQGIDADILEELFSRVEQAYTIECVPWKRALVMVETGEADGVFPGFKTAEREAFADFLQSPVHLSQYQLFALQDSEISFASIEDLYGKVVGIDLGHSVTPAFDEAKTSGAILVEEASSTEQGFNKLLQGRIDVYVNNGHVGNYFAKQMGISEQVVALSHPIGEANPSYLMFSKLSKFEDKEQLIEELNQALGEMWEDGTIERITSQYLD